jgi:molecular chaperone IbpA
MKSIDLTPLYRSSIGFDQLASILDNAMKGDTVTGVYPPYNIEMLDENKYAITLAVAGFEDSELDVKVEKGVLTVRGEKSGQEERNYLHQGIANRTFERKFNLADHIEITQASLNNGLLTIRLFKEIPEAMKPRSIPIYKGGKVIEHEKEEESSNQDKKSKNQVEHRKAHAA